MSDVMSNSLQSEIESVRRRIKRLKKRMKALTKHERRTRERSVLLFKELEGLEGILRPLCWLRSWVFGEYALIVFLWIQRCEERLVRYEFRLAGLKKLDRDEFELAVLMDIKELTNPVRPPGVG